MSESTLLSTQVLLLDCQTTGMRPSNGSLLEIAWAWFAPADTTEPVIETTLVKLPDGEAIPDRVSEITGIRDQDLEQAISKEDLRTRILASLESRNQNDSRTTAIIHYAQFERPFLEDLLGVEKLPFEVVCTYQLSKRLFPHLPSQNIRGVSGFFGDRVGEIKRASSHVRATIEIWRGLSQELAKQGVLALDEVPEWLKGAPKTKSARYEYRVDKEKRLALPDRPGIYRMISKNGEILYVGKATSLKDRVNSYFRGKRGRDKRKLELMAQVWDLRVTETRTAVEAAILESDEIKKYDPPYNVTFKTGRRRLVYYSRDFSQLSEKQDEAHPLGPFRRFNNIERLNALAISLRTGLWQQVFYEIFLPDDLEIGFQAFLDRHCSEEPESRHRLSNIRSLLALGCKLLRMAPAEVEEVDPSDAETETPATPSAEEVLSPSEFADKFERLLMRGASELRRTRAMTRLLNSHVRWQSPEGWVDLELHRGSIGPAASDEKPTKPANPSYPWTGLSIADYDRMSILVSEIAKYPHQVEPL